LVVCEDNAYHRLLHVRADAYRATGQATWRQCVRCHEWDDPCAMRVNQRRSGGGVSYAHRGCDLAYRRRVRGK
jgi:hypothetical protein